MWARPEKMTIARPVYSVTAGKPGSDVAGETAAALAAASILFKSSDSNYANKLRTTAEKVFKFAWEKKGKYSDAISDAAIFYK